MANRLEILAHEDDGRAEQIRRYFAELGKTVAVHVADVYASENPAIANDDFIGAVHNPVTQDFNKSPEKFDYALEIGFLPGVTDNIGHTAREILELSGQSDEDQDNAVFTSRLYYLGGDITAQDVEKLSATLHNPLIQRAHIKSASDFQKDGGMDMIIPKVMLDNHDAAADSVDLASADDAELERIGKEGLKNEDGSRRGPLGMSLLYMSAVRDYFVSEGRPPFDIEVETIAQTWSEHCKHTIFASPIDDIKDGLYKHYIKRATHEIRAKKGDNDICVSVFSDNAGAIMFDDNWLITDKVETHNTPSALDPFGGSITGIVGVNRDCLGFGMGAKPVINRYGFCLADPRTKPEYYRDQACTNAVLSPQTIMNGVVAGVESGGNQSGIPTPQGFLYFDDRYVGKPLVFVGTIGLIPREINGKPSHEKKARPGDFIVMAGGRVGLDGIHGATFSSEALDEGSPATAVQIGDPITQKKMSDAIIKELRELGLYSAITDNGAGGLSSSVGEMAEQSGGFHVALDKIPLKYPGMAPWEIWISESQERMTLAVPPENAEEIIAHLAKRGVEATVIGIYTDSGRAVCTWNGDTVMDMAMDFLHDGVPETPLTTSFTRGGDAEPDIPTPSDYEETLCALLSRPNICSKEFISAQYDHNVQGSAVLGPLQGPGRVYAEATITRPVLDNPRAVVLSQGMFPRYSDIDTRNMALCSLDHAVRNAIAAGGNIEHLALLDNFCWCSSDEPERLGQLKRAVEAIYDLAVTFETPFISGKDSMFNDFKGFDADGNPVKISAPPTLVVSSIGVIENVDQSVSLDPKRPGDLVYLLGETKDELGGSEYYAMHDALGQNVPDVNFKTNHILYKILSTANRKRLISSSYALGHGGLAAGLSKKCIASGWGMDLTLNSDLPLDKMLFSESAGRVVCTVAPQNRKAFEKTLGKFHYVEVIGFVTHTKTLNINSLKIDIEKMERAYKSPLEGY